MPNVWTHFLFGKALAERIGYSAATRTPELERTFHLGCQGPDFLFYHRFLPWQRSAGMPKLGGAMHSRRCGPFLLDLLSEMRGRPLDAPEVVFSLGFLTHHILDRNAHPYVFYRSGFKKWDHQRFEVIIDTLVVRKLLGLETWNTPVWKQIDTGGKLPGDMAAIFNKLARTHYPEEAGPLTAADWNEACRDMIRAQRLFHDPSGLKRRLTLGQIEPLVYKRDILELDYLNESRQQWLHPSLEDERHTESFWDLWDLAMEDGLAAMNAALAYLQAPESDPDARSNLEAAIGDLSYETGKACTEGYRIVHADPLAFR